MNDRSTSRRGFLRGALSVGKAAAVTSVAAGGLRLVTPKASAFSQPPALGHDAHVVILGSGFAAMTAIRELRKKGIVSRITVVSPFNELIYLPSLIWVPAEEKTAADLTVPLQDFFRQQQVNWHQGRVLQVTENGRKVITDNGELDNDWLIVATGGRYLKTLPGIDNVIIPCEGVAAAESIRDRLKAMEGGTIAIGFSTNPDEPAAVRGGPMFEFLFGIDTLLRRQGRRDKFRIVFVNPSQKPGGRLGESAVQSMLERMRRQGIETHLGHKILGFESDKILTSGGSVSADLILFMTGLTGPQWLDNSDLPRSSGGFIACDQYCRANQMERVYVAGDSGSYPGPGWMAKQAHQADLQAEAVVSNIAEEMQGLPARHGFKTELVCIIDSLDSGVLVYRSESHSFVSPGSRVFHWMKKGFERHYLSQYR